MKKNITINLFGQLYAIDEDAYELPKKYEDTANKKVATKLPTTLSIAWPNYSVN